MQDKPFRVLPRVDDENEHFWTGGEAGELRFLRCQDCGWWIHPPSPICAECLSRNIAVEAASGRGVVHTFTVNHQPWIPGFDPPYVVAIVELVEQAGLRWDPVERFGQDYADTLKLWDERFQAAWSDIRRMGGFDERFRRLWRFYLAYCEAGFRSARTDVIQLALTRA